METEAHTDRERETDRQRKRQTDRQTEKERERLPHTQNTDRDIEGGEKDTDRNRQR